MKKKFIFLYLVFVCNGLPAKKMLDKIKHKKEINMQRQKAINALPNKTGKPKKLIKDMDFEEASHAKSYYEIMDDSELVIKCLERMITSGKNSHSLKKARLDLAHAYEKATKNDKALKVYEEFAQLYPGSTECEEAQYKIIKINFAKSNDYRHDQTKTVETIDLAKNFLEPENNHVNYKQEVEQVLTHCYEKLCDHDIYIARHYITQFAHSENIKDLNAAKHRIKHCKNKYLPHAPSKQAAVDAVYKKIETYESSINEKSDDAQEKESITTSKFL